MQRHFEGVVAALVALLSVMGPWTALPSGASAQEACPGDAGSCADAGGTPPLGAGSPDAGTDGEPAEPPGIGGDVCSCETLLEDDGTIHLCTDSYERDVCEQFSCERGTERTRPCPSRGVQLCCEMPDEGTQSRLYDDCTHPNCESGFRDQCGDFGGTVHEGDCDVSAEYEAPEDEGLCAVMAPGASGPARWAVWASLGLVALLTARRRSR